jgi:hypothetical protein
MPKRANYLMVDEDDPDFKRWWMAYPNRASKKDARRVWAAIAPTSAAVDRWMDTLAWQCQQPQWVKDDGQYVPLPTTYLRGERYDDEMPAHLKPHVRRCWHDHEPACTSRDGCEQKWMGELRAQRDAPKLRAV